MSRPIPHAEFADNAATAATLDTVMPGPAFSRTERIVLDIAWQEGLEPLPREGRLFGLARRLFGARPQLPLGNARLEALRQYGMWLRRLGAGAVPATATAALMAAGYNADQIAALQMTFAAFGPGRAVHGRHRADA